MNALADRLRARPWLPPLLAALLYGGLHLVWYWGTPFGVAPVLDERENLDLARSVAAGALPAEPFYRAMGYPLLLALFPAASQPFAATALGLALHAANSALAAALARRLFGTLSAALIAGLLHAFNPVLLFYATQIQDGVLANTFFLLGLAPLLVPKPADAEDDTTAPSATWPRALGSALAWSGAALVRPQFLVLLPLWPAAWWWLRRDDTPPKAARRGDLRKSLFVALAAAASPWLALGLWQARVGGEFRLLPTQGAYNLWAANRPGADGRYFVQSIHLSPTEDGAHQNPTLHESLALFEREAGRPAASLDEANAHWRSRLRAAVADAPGAWFALTARKAVWLLNDFDAYNNKTYAFHQMRAPWLAPNPLGWGLLLVLAVPGACVLARRRPRAALVLGLVFATVAGGILLTFVSGRFRLPLAAMLCVCAGGLAGVAALSARARLVAALAVIGAVALAFGDWFGARDTRTFLQDELLLASSAIEAGDDATAWAAAGAALVRSPGHPDALAWRVTAGFNRLLAAPLPPADETAWQEAAAALLVRLDHDPAAAPPPSLIAIAGLARWRAGEPEAALAVWQDRAARHHEAPSLAAWHIALALSPGHPVLDAPSPAADRAAPFGVMWRSLREPPDTPERLAWRTLTLRLFHTRPDSASAP